jgi:hypothetical protein
VTEQEAREHSSTDALEIEVLRLESLKQQKREIEVEIADIEDFLDKVVEKTYEVEDGEDKVVATVVRGYIDKFQEAVIVKDYPEIWEVITRRVADKKLYAQAIRDGKITEDMNSRFLISVPKKTYVLVDRVHEGDE